MIYTLCYVSKANEGMNEDTIEDIFHTTVENNTKKGIHGILMYGMGNFFQVLEGDKKLIEKLYEDEIKADHRHFDIFEVMRRPTQQAIFSGYSSLFTIVRTSEQLENIKSYLATHRINTTSDKLRRLLNPFLLEI